MKCCDITPAKLRHRISIERENSTTDSVGGRSALWVEISNPYAMVKPVSGSERVYSMRIESNVTHRIIVRYGVDVTPKDKVIFKGRSMNVKAVINLEERDKWLELHCIENVAT